VHAIDARREFSLLVRDWLPPTILSEARLLLHEVVSAIVLAQGPESTILVRVLQRGPRSVRVEVVAPHSAAFPRATRGLRLLTGLRRRVVNAAADRWGIVLDPLGPYVWFELGAP